MEATPKRVDHMEDSMIHRGRGRARKTLTDTVKDLDQNGLSENLVFDRTQWHYLIRIADPT